MQNTVDNNLGFYLDFSLLRMGESLHKFIFLVSFSS